MLRKSHEAIFAIVAEIGGSFGCTATEVADEMGIKPGYASGMLCALVKAGRIERAMLGYYRVATKKSDKCDTCEHKRYPTPGDHCERYYQKPDIECRFFDKDGGQI